MADYGRIAALNAGLVNETTERARLAALNAGIVNETTARARLAALNAGIVNETTARGRVAALSMIIVWQNVEGAPSYQGNVSQGILNQSGDAVPQGSSLAMQGSRAQGG